MSTSLRSRQGRLGESVARPDGIPKVRGQFAFSSDLFAEGMLWAHIVRSPHPSAIIRSIDVSMTSPGASPLGSIIPTSPSSRGKWFATWERPLRR